MTIHSSHRPLSGTVFPHAAAALLLAALAMPADAGTSFGVDNVRWVEAGGTSTENCDSLRAVLTSIDDNSSANRYAIHLGPHTYDCGESSIFLGAGIALIGSSREQTRLLGGVDNAIFGLVHVLGGGGNALRSMSIRNNRFNPTFGDISVSVFPFGQNQGTARVELFDLQVGDPGDNQYALYVDGSSVVEGSNVEFGNRVYHDGQNTLRFRYCAMNGVDGPGKVECVYSHVYSDHEPVSPTTCEPVP